MGWWDANTPDMHVVLTDTYFDYDNWRVSFLICSARGASGSFASIFDMK